MKKARLLLALIFTCVSIAGIFAFKARTYNAPTFYCTTVYGAPGTISIYPTIALPTTAYCTTQYSYNCYKSTIISFDFQ
ncbi:hypothetical protein SIO70_00225 [Chitinophaga sancti]|uniref:hypothetical protein n=1 Tax=Chitinophaga sancti TaxID=1004 RepID=UPI002A74FEBB|nr:hypothetical protein [Chitinophaga sancti]WPQ63288.1 hypothetical protein SIO70_00225 [Chitinophaga sancti]